MTTFDDSSEFTKEIRGRIADIMKEIDDFVVSIEQKIKARENIAQKQQKPAHRIQSEELEKFQDELTSKLTNDGVKTKVKISQSRIEGKMHIVAKGNVESTLSVLKRIRDAIINS